MAQSLFQQAMQKQGIYHCPNCGALFKDSQTWEKHQIECKPKQVNK